ncbi:MAG TPA: dihydroorotase [Thermoanaerobaculia bacterium]|nr:dihydroorotase [Thermoanaerobaculia bacterium]
MSRRLLVRGGRVVDPAAGRNGRADVLLENGVVAQVADRLEAGDAEVFDASKLHVFPGFIDLHAHLREPGREYAETIHTGLRAAAAGGFTAVCAMPNTNPVNDSREVCEFVRARGVSAGSARLHPIAAITIGQRGEAMTAFGELKEAGAVAVSDDGKWLEDGALLRAAFEHASLFGLPIVQHAEDKSLSQGAPMHEGAVSTRLGLSGQPALAEAAAVARDLLVAELTGGRLHVAHLSTAKALDMVRRAKASGLAVTCEVTPHHLVLTDEEVAATAFSTRVKMNPPLREASDVAALVAGLADGTVDAIATDHAPHHADEKAVDFDSAPFGVVGLETAASVVYDRLVARGRLSLDRFVALFTAGPAKAFGLPGGTLAPGSPADLTLFDTEARWKVDPDRFVSKGRSTPFSGWELGGAPAATIVAGNVVWQRVEL